MYARSKCGPETGESKLNKNIRERGRAEILHRKVWAVMMGTSPKRSMVDSMSVISNQRAYIVSITGFEAKCVACRAKTEGPHKKQGYIIDSFQTNEENGAHFLGSGADKNQIQNRPQHWLDCRMGIPLQLD